MNESLEQLVNALTQGMKNPIPNHCHVCGVASEVNICGDCLPEHNQLWRQHKKRTTTARRAFVEAVQDSVEEHDRLWTEMHQRRLIERAEQQTSAQEDE